MNDDLQQCKHLTINQRFCCRCGSYYEKTMNVYGIKNNSLNRQSLYSHDIIYNLRINQFDLSRNKDYLSQNNDILNIFTQINKICSQLQTTFQTKMLASYIFWHSLPKNKMYHKKDMFVSIFIALKYQQTSVIKLHNQEVRQQIFQPIFTSGIISQKQLMFEQMQKLEKINFRLKLITFVDFLEFYVISGVMFSNQSKKNSNYNKIIYFIDSQIERYMHKGLFFTQPNQQYLALKILYNARQKCGGIDEIWNWHIQYVTKTKKDMIDKIINQRKALISLKEFSLNVNIVQTCFKQKKQQNHYEYRNKSVSLGNRIYSSARKNIIR